jgi:hypothetical protein
MRYLLLFAILGCLSYGCEKTTPYDQTTYPSEEDFASTDTIAFYLNDLLWLPLGRRSSSAVLQAYKINRFDYSTFSDPLSDVHTFWIRPFMILRYEDRRILHQKLEMEIKQVPAELLYEGTVLIDGSDGRTMRIRDELNDKVYQATPEHSVLVTFTSFESASGRVEAFFSGSIIGTDTTAEVKQISDGRVTMVLE